MLLKLETSLTLELGRLVLSAVRLPTKQCGSPLVRAAASAYLHVDAAVACRDRSGAVGASMSSEVS